MKTTIHASTILKPHWRLIVFCFAINRKNEFRFIITVLIIINTAWKLFRMFYSYRWIIKRRRINK